MKIRVILAVIIFTTNVFAQSPQKMSYQAIIRNSSNILITNTTIGMRVSILQGSSMGTVVYVETQRPVTDVNGLATINIGSGSIVSGSFSTINWSAGLYFVKTETDPTGGINYTISGISQLLSVPYSLYSSSCGQVGGSISIVNYGAFPAPDWAHAIDNTAAIQAAIDANPGKSILFPAGYYRTSRDIVVRNSVVLAGEGQGNTIIQPVDCNGFVVTSSGVTIRDMFIYGYSSTGNGKDGIYLQSVYNTVLENLRIQNVWFGIDVVSSWNTKIDKVDIMINSAQTPQISQGIRLEGLSVNNHISNCHIEATVFGISIINNQAQGLMVSNTFIGLAQSGIYSEGILDLNINNCIIDLNTGWAIYVKNTRSMLFSNNWVSSTTGTEAIHMEASNDCHISNNFLICSTSGTRSISVLSYSNLITIIGNSIQMENSSGVNVYFDNTTSTNILKGNVLKRPSGSTFITNTVSSNNTSDNSTIIQP